MSENRNVGRAGASRLGVLLALLALAAGAYWWMGREEREAEVGGENRLEDIRAAFLAWASVLTRNATQRKFMKFVLSRVEWSDALKRTLARKVDAVTQDNPYARLERGLARVRAAGGLVSPLDDTQVAGLLCSVFFGIFREAWLHKTAVPVLPTLEAGLDFILQGIRRQ